MGIPAGPWYIDDLLTFTVNTHRVDTGAGTDADAVPSYRVYEDETGTAIGNGNTAKLDDANTVGFYSEQLTLSAANGYEAGKSYSVYVSATVNSVTATQSLNFKVIAAPTLPANSDIAAIKAKTDNLPSDPADASVVAGLIAAVETKVDTVDAVVDAIKLQTDNLPTDPADQSLVIAATDALATLIGDVPTNAELTTALASADDAVLAAVAAVDTKIDTIDTVVDAVKAKTDSLTFTVAGQVDANITYVNDVAVTGDGSGTPWGPA